MNGQLHSSIVCLVHGHLGMKTGPGFLDFESPGVCSTEQHRGGWSIQNDQNHSGFCCIGRDKVIMLETWKCYFKELSALAWSSSELRAAR